MHVFANAADLNLNHLRKGFLLIIMLRSNYKLNWHNTTFTVYSIYSIFSGLLPLSSSSQNPRMVGVGKALWGSPSPTPCRSRITQSRLQRTSSGQGLSISREGDSTSPLGSLGQGSVTLTVKRLFLLFRWNFLCFSLCPLPLVLLLGTTEKSLTPSSRHSPLRYL